MPSRLEPIGRGRNASLAGLLVVGLLAACNDESSGPELTPVASGTIGGIPFTVSAGTIYQVGADGPLYADEGGGRIVLDDSPTALGMSDADLLHLRTYFAISQEGSLRIAAFGDAGSPFETGVTVALRRVTDAGLVYELRFAGELAADSAFEPQPAVPSAEHWVVAELYADSVPGLGAGQAGAALWPIGDLTPAVGEEVLGCAPEPATSPTPLAGEAVGYALDDAWLLEVEVVDQIVGPCR